jgi:tetratricopeptide (TPR) repeat protein
MFAHEIGNRQFEADCIFASAQIAIHRHEYEAAWKDYHSALNIYSAIRFPVGEAGCLTGLGKLASAFGNADDAYTLIMQGLEIFANYCDGPLASRGQAEGHYSLASLAMQQNNSAEALKQIAQALPFFTSTGDRGGEGKCDMLLGMLAFRRSDYDGARAHFKAALGIFETLAIPLSIAACLRDLGELEMACSRYTEAADYYQRALALFRIIGDGLGEAECLSALTTIQKAPK